MATEVIRVRTALAGPADSYMLNTFFFDSSTASAAEARLVVNDFWTALEPRMNQNVSWEVEQECSILAVSTGTLSGVDSDFTVYSGTGSEDNDPLPWATQGLAQWGTTGIVNGRRVRGRTFIPGACEEHSNGRPDSGYLSTLAGAAAALAASTTKPQVWSRPISSGPHTRSGQSFDMTSGVAWGQWAVLRKRRG